MIQEPLFWALAIPAVAITGVSKGGLGGGAAVATPLMALAIAPAQAAAILLPVLCVMDLAGVKAYLGRWDRHIIRILLPAGLLGTVIGALTVRHMNDDWIRIMLGVIALGFVAWTLYPRKRLPEKPGDAAGWFWGCRASPASSPTPAARR